MVETKIRTKWGCESCSKAISIDLGYRKQLVCRKANADIYKIDECPIKKGTLLSRSKLRGEKLLDFCYCARTDRIDGQIYCYGMHDYLENLKKACRNCKAHIRNA